jgi:autotransporter adhesin
MNRIYRLVWCRSRRVLVVASELASAHHGGGSSGTGSVDRRAAGSTRKLLLAALISTGGMLFASGAYAQSTGDAKLDDLQSLVAKYDTSRVGAAPVQAMAGTQAAGGAVASAAAPSIIAPAITPHALPSRVVAVIRSSRAVASSTPAPASNAPTAPITYGAPGASSSSVGDSDEVVTSLHSGQANAVAKATVDVADRNRQQATGADVQLAQQSSLVKTDLPTSTTTSAERAGGSVATASVNPVTSDTPSLSATAAPVASVSALPAIVSTAPLAMVAPSVPTKTPDIAPGVGAIDKVAAIPLAPAASAAVSVASTPAPPLPLASSASVAAISGTPSAAVESAAAPLPQKAPVAPAAIDAVDKATAAGTAVALSEGASVSAAPLVSTTSKASASGELTDGASTGGAASSVALASQAADRRLKHAADASVSLDAKPVVTVDDTEDAQSLSTATASVSPLTFTPLSAVSASSTDALLPSLQAPVALSGSLSATVPVFPTPSNSPTGLIVGNGGVVGTATQLLGSTTNSLFAGGNGYVTNGSLQVNNANFSQGYSVISVLGIPTLTLDPVGTLLTSTSGAVVGGTGYNSHLTLLGGVTSDSYIYNINNGSQNGLLGIALPSSAPAFASTCLSAPLVSVACYGINAAQDYQVLVGDGATANGSKEVVIGTNASHTLPLVNADTAFPGSGTNDPNNPTGVPTADYEARLGHSVVIGDSASGTANAQVILGAEATANAANSVALGYQSVANRGGSTNYTAYGLTALQTSAGEVSIGSMGQERQITNVAAGSSATDAVNLEQLEGVSADAANSVQYDDGSKASITLAGPASADGGVTGGTKITNLQQGALSATSTDAVNGAQLYATNNTVSNIYNTTSKFFQANSIGLGSSAAGVDTIAAGPAAVATGAASVALGSGATTGLNDVNAVAIGTGAHADFANSIALGSGSVTTVGAQVGYTAFGLATPQTSSGELAIGNRQITGVAAGLAATDAVNVEQLQGVAAGSVQYDDGSKASVTLAGTPSTDGGLTNGTTVTNLHQGNLTATSTDAVNGAQLYATNNTVSNIYNTTSKFFQANSMGLGSSAVGVDTIAAGPAAVATGDASVALGSGATTGLNDVNAVAIGTGAHASFANSIALGSGSVTTVGAQVGYTAYGLALPQTSAGELAIGNRQITGVAAGQSPTDAVNVAQLEGVSADAANSVQYDNVGKTSITLGGAPSIDGGLTNGTTVTNLHQGNLTATSTDAVNGAQLYATNNTVSNIYNTTSKFFQANSIGLGSSAVGVDTIAAGPAAVATGDASVALGSGATTGLNDVNAVAIGTGAHASFANSIALGSGSVTTVGAQVGYTAYGLAIPQTSAGEVSIGSPGQERQITNVAAGSSATDAVNVAQLEGVAADAGNSVQYDNVGKTSITLAGTPSTDGGLTNGTTVTNLHQGNLTATSTDAVNGAQLYATDNTVSTIYNTTSKYFQANSTGIGSSALGVDSIAAGPAAVAGADTSIALGSGALTGAGSANAVAIGTGATASFANSIALGSGSITTVGALTGYAAYGLATPQTSAGELNIGNRQITGLAPGKADSDAVNVAQLEGVSADAANSVQYDSAARTSVTLAGIVSTDGGVTNGTTLTNLHQGMLSATSTDAVNGAQLWHWTQDTTNQYSNYSLYNDLTTSPGNKFFSVDSILSGASATGLNAAAAGPNSNAAGTDSFAMGNGANAQGDYTLAISDNTMASAANSIAIGNGSTASFANSIALGAGSMTTVGAQTNYIAYGLAAPQTSVGELNIGNRQITGVAAGSSPTDAVNLAQLEAVASQAGGGTTNSKLGVVYDADASGNPTNTVTLTGDGTGKPVTVTNVAAGAESVASTDAINGSQLYHWTQDTTNAYSNLSLYNDFTSLSQNAGSSSKYVQVNSTAAGATAGGTNSVAIGPTASSAGANSVAVGSGASAAADNSVALGAGSVASRDNTVSVGSPGSERQITNVAAGTADTDAANVGQVNSGVQQAENWASNYTDQRIGALSSQIQQIGNRANAGVAAAMAMAGLPQAYEPGKSMAAVAAGTFRSESSIAVGVSTISEGGRWVYKLTGSVDTRGDGGLSVGAGMQW